MITVEHCAQQPIFVARACATSLTLAPKESSLTPQRLLRVLIQKPHELWLGRIYFKPFDRDLVKSKNGTAGRTCSSQASQNYLTV